MRHLDNDIQKLKDLLLEQLEDFDDEAILQSLTQLLIAYFLSDPEGINMKEVIVVHTSSVQGDFKMSIERTKPAGPRLVQ